MAEQTDSENSKETPADRNSPASGDEISLLDILIVLAKRKRMVLGVPFIAAVVAAIVSLLLPSIYTGTTRILPPQQSASAASALLGQLGGALGGLAGAAGGALGIKNPNDLYVGMLKSRTVADNLIARFDLNKLYNEEFQSSTRKDLERNTTIVVGKDGIISIEFNDKEPKRAAEIANAYVDELANLTRVLAVTEASQRRLFFERQLTQAKENLAAAEILARQSLQKGGIAQVDAQGRSMVEVTARLRAQISFKEVQLGAMRTFAAEGNADLQRTQQELEALKAELSRVEGTSPLAAGKAAVADSNGLDSVHQLRNVKYYEILYELLARQYELARIDEARDAALIQVVDKAIEPDRRSKPERKLIVVIVFLLAGIASVITAFILESLERAKSRPEQAAKIGTLRAYIAGR